MTPYGPGLSLIDGDPLRFFGIPFTTRMSVVQLQGGGLWLHSPVAPSPERFAAVEALGEVRHLVAPNPFHHLYLGPWAERFPQAELWAEPGLPARRKDLRFHHVLGDAAEPAWADDLDQVHFVGSKLLNEVVFLHRASRTLLVTDILQNHDPHVDGWLWRQMKSFIGVLSPKGGAPLDWRLTVTDRASARRARDRILAWDFDRVVLTHGLCVEQDAHAWVERAFSWLGEG